MDRSLNLEQAQANLPRSLFYTNTVYFSISVPTAVCGTKMRTCGLYQGFQIQMSQLYPTLAEAFKSELFPFSRLAVPQRLENLVCLVLLLNLTLIDCVISSILI